MLIDKRKDKDEGVMEKKWWEGLIDKRMELNEGKKTTRFLQAHATVDQGAVSSEENLYA